MPARVNTGCLMGVDAVPVEVETDAFPGVPLITIVGLAGGAVRESALRVRSAVVNSGYPFPARRITVNLAPAALKKEGAGFDLPIAVGILAAMHMLPEDMLDDYLIVGELSLDGQVKPIRGALSIAIAARDMKLTGVILPKENEREAAVTAGVKILGVTTLLEAATFLSGRGRIRPAEPAPAVVGPTTEYAVDFAEIKGQEFAKRAAEVSAAGGHNLLMIGPPGSGKSMISHRIPTILPMPVFEEAIETTKVYSAAGLLERENGALMQVRPFRSPHHTVSDAGLIGGGMIPRPGEVSLAHNGVLFLDELPEFRKNVLEVLRQPLEDGHVTISRAQTALTFPARFMLVAAMNPCPCGYHGDPKHNCVCPEPMIRKYWSRISGPLLDRIDIHVEVPAIEWRDLTSIADGEPSEKVRARVDAARVIQLDRLKKAGIYCNAQMRAAHIKKFCALGSDSLAFLERAVDKLGLSARAYHRILKIARTIADLESAAAITTGHVGEAVQYRSLDRRYRS